MEVDCRPLIMSETDLPDPFPDLTALPLLTNYGGHNCACQITADLPMEWRPTTCQIYEYNSPNVHDESILNKEEKKSTTPNSYTACPPVDVPAKHIPPKPPYLTRPTMTTKRPEKALPHLNDWWGHSSEEQLTLLLILHGPTPASSTQLKYSNNLLANSPQTLMTSSATQCGGAISPIDKADVPQNKDQMGDHVTIPFSKQTLAIVQRLSFYNDG